MSTNAQALSVEADEYKIKEWSRLRCTECDDSVCFLPPEIKFFGSDVLPVFCFQCAVHLESKDN